MIPPFRFFWIFIASLNIQGIVWRSFLENKNHIDIKQNPGKIMINPLNSVDVYIREIS
jgi:hypothetical protein